MIETEKAGHLEEIVACFDTIKSQAEMLHARNATIEKLQETVDSLIIANRKLSYALHEVSDGKN